MAGVGAGDHDFAGEIVARLNCANEENFKIRSYIKRSIAASLSFPSEFSVQAQKGLTPEVVLWRQLCLPDTLPSFLGPISTDLSGVDSATYFCA